MKTIEQVKEFINKKIKGYEHTIKINKEAGYNDTVMIYEFRKHHYQDILDYIDSEDA